MRKTKRDNELRSVLTLGVTLIGTWEVNGCVREG